VCFSQKEENKQNVCAYRVLHEHMYLEAVSKK
jgi:hypothetical protein